MPTEILADLTLSRDAEQIAVRARGNRITIVFPNVFRGVRYLRLLMDQRDWLVRLEDANATLSRLGLSLYVKAGPISAPVLGAEAHQRALPALKDLMRRLALLRQG